MVDRLTVVVRVPSALRPFAGGQSRLRLELPAGRADVAAVLDGLAGGHPGLERRVRDEQGRLRPHVNIFVGETNIRDAEHLATPVHDGTEVVILPAVSGGTGSL